MINSETDPEQAPQSRSAAKASSDPVARDGSMTDPRKGSPMKGAQRFGANGAMQEK